MLPRASHFTFATINLQNFLAPPEAFYSPDNIYSCEAWLAKKRWLKQQLHRLSADIVGFQEVFSADELHHLVSECGYSHFCCLSQPTISDGYLYSDPVLALASRFAINECELLDTCNAQPCPDEFRFSRQPLHTTIKLPGIGLCDFYVVHLKSQRPTDLELVPCHEDVDDWISDLTGSWISTVQRGYEALFIQQHIIANRLQHKRPFMLMGDFNQSLNSIELAPFRSPPVATYEGLSYKMFDSWELYNCQGCLTRPATHYHKNREMIIDYILVSDEFNPQSAHCLLEIEQYLTLDKHLVEPDFDHDGYASDHAVIAIRTKLR